MAAAMVVALLAPEPVGLIYKGGIVLGLVVATVAVVLLLSRFLPDYAAHGHLMFVYLLYFVAFASRTSFPLPSLWALLIVAGWAAAYFQFTPYLRELWGAVIAYGLALGLAAWQAIELVVQQPEAPWAWVALAGMLLIVAVHAVQAIDQFRTPIRVASLAVPALVLAHCAVAWSVWRFAG
jgi:uncharacterized membrane protein YhhN